MYRSELVHVRAFYEHAWGWDPPPTIEAATAALAAAQVHTDLTYDTFDAPVASAYPITALTYLLVRTGYGDFAIARLAKGFLTYILSEGPASPMAWASHRCQR